VEIALACGVPHPNPFSSRERDRQPAVSVHQVRGRELLWGGRVFCHGLACCGKGADPCQKTHGGQGPRAGLSFKRQRVLVVSESVPPRKPGALETRSELP